MENDPEYEDIHFTHRSQQLEVLKQDAQEATVRKIKNLIDKHFTQDIEMKESELNSISKNLTEAKCVMDHLRACIITKYYSNQLFKPNEGTEVLDSIHPQVKPHLGKAPRWVEIQDDHNYPILLPDPLEFVESAKPQLAEKKSVETNPEGRQENPQHIVRRNVKILVGNISKYILNEERSKDQATHKWMIYVRPQDPRLESGNLISRILVFLHPSYKPNDLVEIRKPPFCVCRRGWGEFPIRVQIHFHNPRNKPIDVIHQLKLDKTFTGLQTLGGESVVDVMLYTAGDGASAKAKANLKSVTQGVSDTDNSTLQLSSADIDCNVTFKQVSCDPLILQRNIKLENEMDFDSGQPSCDSLMLRKNINFEKEDSLLVGESATCHVEVPCNEHKQTISSASVFNYDFNLFIDSKNKATNNLHHEVRKRKRESDDNLVKQSTSANFYSLKNDNSLLKVNTNLEVNSPTTINASNNDVKNFEPVLRIASATPIQISVQPSTLNGFSSPVVHFVQPNAAGECIVPLKLLKQEANSTNQCAIRSESDTKEKNNEETLNNFISNLRIEEYSSVHEIMLHLIKLYPIISEEACFPFNASSREVFSSWTIGRKLAAEWQRTRQVQRALKEVLNLRFTSEAMWNVKRIWKWARKHGFTPCLPDQQTEDDANVEEGRVNDHKHTSGLTSTEPLLKQLEEKRSKIIADVNIDLCKEDDDSFSVLDVERIETPGCPTSPDKPTNSAARDLENSELAESVCVKTVLMQVCKDFLSDVLHQSLGMATTRQRKDWCSNIACADVYNSVNSLTFCDFLTNQNMGIEQL